MSTSLQTQIISGLMLAVGVYFALTIPRDIAKGIASGKYGQEKRKVSTLMKVLGYIMIVCAIVLFGIGTFVES